MNEKMKQELKEYVYMIAFDGWKDATDDSVMEAIDDFFQSYQPERSKQEDSLLRELLESSSGKLDTSEHAEPPLVWDKDLNFIGHKVLEDMRCSEQSGN